MTAKPVSLISIDIGIETDGDNITDNAHGGIELMAATPIIIAPKPERKQTITIIDEKSVDWEVSTLSPRTPDLGLLSKCSREEVSKFQLQRTTLIAKARSAAESGKPEEMIEYERQLFDLNQNMIKLIESQEPMVPATSL